VGLSKTEEIFISDFNRHDSTGMHFSLIRHDSTGLERTAVLNARRIKLIEKPDKWQLSGIRRRVHIDTLKDEYSTYLPHEKIDTSFGLLISDLVVRNNVKDEMTTIELNQYIDRERLKGTGGFAKFEVEKHRRSADAFSIIILTLIGFSISSRKLRGGMAWNLVLGVALSALYILMGKFSMTFSISGGLSPFLGAWVPNIIFTIVAVFMVFRAQK
jgi:lipopolysaccharide export system permease protein